MATIHDVAKKAGVSVGTVSRAFNNYKDIKAETKEKIFAAAAELEYSPNVIAKSLSSKQKGGIGLIILGLQDSDGSDNIFFSLIKGITNTAAEKKVELSLYPISREKQEMISFTKFCKERNLAGVIIQGIATDDVLFQELLTNNIPCVGVDMLADKNHFSGVITDNIKACKEVVELIVNNGHSLEHTVILAGAKNAVVTIERTAGFYEGFKESGVEMQRTQIFNTDFTEDSAYKTMESVLKKYPETTAVLCMSDLIAIAAMKAIQDSGRVVPDDISVVGFDGVPLSGYVHPTLTTVQQDFLQIAEIATLQLIKQIEEKDAGTLTEQLYAPHKLIERDSVKNLKKV